jgi:hypothetical protein
METFFGMNRYSSIGGSCFACSLRVLRDNLRVLGLKPDHRVAL